MLAKALFPCNGVFSICILMQCIQIAVLYAQTKPGISLSQNSRTTPHIGSQLRKSIFMEGEKLTIVNWANNHSKLSTCRVVIEIHYLEVFCETSCSNNLYSEIPFQGQSLILQIKPTCENSCGHLELCIQKAGHIGR